jgi:hypothetical protein
MALHTFTLLELEELLSESINDYLQFDTTANTTAGTSITSTELKSYDDGAADYFNDWGVYLTEGNNIGVQRKVSDYTSTDGQLIIRGANLTADTQAVTCRLHRYDRTHITNAIVDACKEIYPSLHRRIDDQTLITGNILPDAHFESWSSTSALTWYTASNCTLAQTSTNALHRGGKYSVKVTNTSANGYVYISSDTYPRLLELAGKEVNFYCQAYPEVANDAYIVIYTIGNDGTTTQTLTSTTTNAAASWTEIKLESQVLNSDLEEIQIRFKVATNIKYAYFDDAYIGGMYLTEYLLPESLRDGYLNQVLIQEPVSSLVQSENFYSIHPFMGAYPGESVGFDIINDNSNSYLKLDSTPLSEHRMRLIGYQPLESPVTDSTTVTIDDEKVNLLIAKAKMIFWEREGVPVSAKDINKFGSAYSRATRDYHEQLSIHRMNVLPRGN